MRMLAVRWSEVKGEIIPKMVSPFPTGQPGTHGLLEHFLTCPRYAASLPRCSWIPESNRIDHEVCLPCRGPMNVTERLVLHRVEHGYGYHHRLWVYRYNGYGYGLSQGQPVPTLYLYCGFMGFYGLPCAWVCAHWLRWLSANLLLPFYFHY